MLLKYLAYIIFLFESFLLCLQIFCEKKVQKEKMSKQILYALLVSFNHMGDLNQANYVNLFLRKTHQQLFDIRIYDIQTEPFQLIKDYEYYHCFGEKGLNFIKSIRSNTNFEGKKIIVQIHQHFPILYQLKPQYLIIPKSTFIDHQSLKQTHKFLLGGILFEKFSQEELKKFFYSSQISKKISPDQQYLIIMLSGDAPDEKQMKYFDKESVDNLFYRLLFLLGRLSYNNIQPRVIVQNGPRTGKHDPKTGKQKCNHSYEKNKESPEKAIDEISLYFIQKLQISKIKYDFFNFSFEISEEGRKVNSFYKPLLYIGMMKQNYFMFPMQSVSMCSQLPFYISSSRLIAYHTSSTNQQHMKVVDEGFNAGRYQKMDGIRKPEYLPKKQESKYDEIQQVLGQIVSQIQKK